VRLVLSVTLALFGGAAGAEPYAVGDRIDPFTLDDQHGEPHRVDESVALVLFGRGMTSDKIVKEALEDADADSLRSRQVVYVAEIKGMPKLVAKLFALPSMRRRPYPMLLDRDGQTTARFPDLAGTVTVLHLDRLQLTRVEYLAEPAELRAVALER
jgi:hypothetical protein